VDTLSIPNGRRVWLPDVKAELDKGVSFDDVIVCAAQGGMMDPEKVDRAKRRIFHTISAAAPDRSRDSIKQDGISFKQYDSNPVWLACHSYWGLPIGQSVEHGVKGGKAFSVCEFWSADDLEHGMLCETIFRLTAERLMRACSIGGKMMKYAFNEQRRGMDIEELELYEVSKVAVPDQPLALAKGAAAAGIDLIPLLDWSFRLYEEAKSVGGVLTNGMPLLMAPDKADALAKLIGYGNGFELIQLSADDISKKRLPAQEEPKMNEPVETKAVEEIAKTPEECGELRGESICKADKGHVGGHVFQRAGTAKVALPEGISIEFLEGVLGKGASIELIHGETAKEAPPITRTDVEELLNSALRKFAAETLGPLINRAAPMEEKPPESEEKKEASFDSPNPLEILSVQEMEAITARMIEKTAKDFDYRTTGRLPI